MCKTIILPTVLYGCETQSLTLTEEHRWRVSESRIGCKRKEMMGDWRRLLNEELHNLYTLHNIVSVIRSRKMRWAGHVARMKNEKCIQNFS